MPPVVSATWGFINIPIIPETPDMIRGMGKQKQDVSLGKAAIFFGVLCVLAVVATSASGSVFYGVIAALAGLLAGFCGVMWGITRDAKNRQGTR